MNKIQVHTSRGLKKVQNKIYSSLETRTAYLVNESHECLNKERYQFMAEEDPTVLLIETNPEMLYELNIALAIYYHHYIGNYVNADTMCPACTCIICLVLSFLY